MIKFLNNLLKVATGKTIPTATKRSPTRAILHVESLEGREMMSVSPMTPDPIQVKYQSLGGANGFLGPAVTAEMNTPVGGGRYELFAGGAIFYSSATGAHFVYTQTEAEWERTASEYDGSGHNVQAILGLPKTDEAKMTDIADAYSTRFQGGHIWHSTANPNNEIKTFATYGAIDAEYAATYNRVDGTGHRVQAILGLPTSEEMNVPGVPGARMNTFQGGAIYWSPATGAHAVYGGIYAKYASIGGPANYGLPITSEANVPHVFGARQVQFQHGNIYWTATTGAHLVYGAILSEYNHTGSEHSSLDGRVVQSILGAPTSDEMDVPGIAGARMNLFQGGAIYWSPTTGAHVVFGRYAQWYNTVGGPANSGLGLPISDEVIVGKDHAIYFQHGRIELTPEGAPKIIYT